MIWKTKDNKWTQVLQREGFHQLLSLNKNTTSDCWGNKIKGWWRRGDIKATKCKKTREYWVKSPTNVPSETVKDIKEALMTPGQNYGKDSYTIDLTGSEATYWLGTESGHWQSSTSMGHVQPETGHVMSDHSRWVRASAT